MFSSAFRFSARRGRLDWRSLSKLDLDRVQREVDIETEAVDKNGMFFGALHLLDKRNLGVSLLGRNHGALRFCGQPGH